VNDQFGLVVSRKTAVPGTSADCSPGTPSEHFPPNFPHLLGEIHPPFTVEDWEKRELAR
jgi:hypothetical protein